MSSYLCTKETDSVENLPTNGFFKFLNSYRQKQEKPAPAWVTAVQASQIWSTMPLVEKTSYKMHETSNCFIYKPNDHSMNRVIRYLEKGLNPDESAKSLIYIAKAVKEMQLWKRKTLKKVLAFHRKSPRQPKKQRTATKKKCC